MQNCIDKTLVKPFSRGGGGRGKEERVRGSIDLSPWDCSKGFLYFNKLTSWQSYWNEHHFNFSGMPGYNSFWI